MQKSYQSDHKARLHKRRVVKAGLGRPSERANSDALPCPFIGSALEGDVLDG